MRISRTIAEQQVTRLNCAPSTFYPLVENPTPTTFDSLQSLKTVFLGGEPIAASRLRQWAEASATELANVYGAAECSDVSSFYRLNDYERYVRNSVPIGKPIANSQVYLLDDALEPVEIGAIGEICIGGAGVGKGYINDAELTAEKFVPNRFSDEPDARLYRTGDLARFAPDWNLELGGRVDHQIKIAASRVHRRHRDLRHALRRARCRRSAKEFARTTTGWWLCRDDRKAATAQFAERRSKPSPQARLPGTVSRLSCCSISSAQSERQGRSRSAVAHRSRARTQNRAGFPAEVERQVAAIFASSLMLDDVGLDDDFFDLGGDSLKAVLAVANVTSQLGFTVPIEALFETRTLRNFCQFLESAPH